MKRLSDGERAAHYKVQTVLAEQAKAGDYESMHQLLNCVLAGSAVVQSPVNDILVTIDRLQGTQGFDSHSAGVVLERILGDSRKDDRGQEIWSPELRANHATYALRILAESKEFRRAGYNKDRIMGLAQEYNENIASYGSRIGSNLMLAKGNRNYIMNLNTGKVSFVPLPKATPERMAAPRVA